MPTFKLVKVRFLWLNSLMVLTFGVFTLLVIRYQIKLLNYIEWGDESETIVTAKMIAAGRSLYGQIFNHHGPLTFLPGVFIEKFGSFGIAGHRVSIALLQLVALMAIYLSPLLNNGPTKRLYTVAAASVMLLYLPEIFGHTYMYQVLAGLFLVIILAQYTLPAIVCPEKLLAKNVSIGNFLIASMPFLAVTYAPISILLFLASLRRGFIAKSAAAFVGGGLSNIVFLAYIGSIPGYFAFHIYLNSKILPLYGGGLSVLQLILNAFNAVTVGQSQFTTLLIITAALACAAHCEKGWPWRVILLALGVGSLLIRGGGFHALPYFYSMLAIPIIFFWQRPITSWQTQIIALVFVLICIIKLSLLMPGDKEKINTRKIPDSTEFSQLARLVTEKNDRIIAYSFQNFQYIAADRLPASGNFFYLPWQEKYNENPKFGIKINACKDISDYRPKIMLIDKWNVWDRFPWDTYAGCIQALMDKEYIQLPGRPYYIRKDIAIDTGLVSSDLATEMQPSLQLTSTSPIRLSMTSGHQGKNNPLKKIGVMFGTYAPQNPGEAELHLKGKDEASFTQMFSLSDLADNKYKYFDLDSKRYNEGEIVFISGGGVSTWESHDEKGGTHTCILYEYADDKRRVTPGCPLF